MTSAVLEGLGIDHKPINLVELKVRDWVVRVQGAMDQGLGTWGGLGWHPVAMTPCYLLALPLSRPHDAYTHMSVTSWTRATPCFAKPLNAAWLNPNADGPPAS